MTSRREVFDERTARTQRRMSLGSLGGRTEQSQPPGVQVTKPTVRGSRLEVVTFVVVGTMEVGLTPRARVMRGGALTMLTFQATAAGTGTTTYRLVVNGVVFTSSISATSSTITKDTSVDDSVLVPVSPTVEAGQKMQIEITAAGLHEQAVFQALLAS